MDNTKKLQIWNEIIEVTKRENQIRRAEEYTVYEFIEQVKQQGGPELRRDRARSILDDLVKSGVLSVRRAYLPEHRAVCALYSPNESA
jgi:hypothetical protein